MDKNQKTALKEIFGVILIFMGVYSDDKILADFAFSSSAALIISGIVDLLNQNSNTNNLPV